MTFIALAFYLYRIQTTFSVLSFKCCDKTSREQAAQPLCTVSMEPAALLWFLSMFWPLVLKENFTKAKWRILMGSSVKSGDKRKINQEMAPKEWLFYKFSLALTIYKKFHHNYQSYKTSKEALFTDIYLNWCSMAWICPAINLFWPIYHIKYINAKTCFKLGQQLCF